MKVCPRSREAEDIMYVLYHSTEIDDNFEYLGRTLSNNGDDTNEVEKRINRGWQSFQNYKSIVNNKHLSIETKRNTYQTYILPTVMYAAETV